jgi:excisionase family DNA binding protein
MAPLLLRAAEVATLLGLGRSTVFALLAAGELPVVRIGRSVRVPRVALERWVDERTDHDTRRGDFQPPLVRHLGDLAFRR